MKIIKLALFLLASSKTVTCSDNESPSNEASSDYSQLRGTRSLSSSGCCSLNFMNCDAQFCGNNQADCESCSQQPVVWLPNGKVTGCLRKWEDCTSDPDGCCYPGTCVATTPQHSQCIYKPTQAPSVTPSTTPSAAPSKGETADACCSLNFKDCDGTFCGTNRESCESCKQNVDVVWLPKGPRDWCLAKWADCTHKRWKCCGQNDGTAQCVKVTDQHYQCQPL